MTKAHILAALLAAAPVLAATPVPNQPPVDSTWYLVGNHLHTSTGGDHSFHHGLQALLNKANSIGLDFAIVTDHNTIDHWFMPEWRTVGKCTPIRGEEWTTPGGHAGLVNFSAKDAKDAILPCTRPDSNVECVNGQPNYKAMVDEVHRRGGLVIINHPKLLKHLWPDDTFQADFIDVAWNLTDPWGNRGRAFWHDMMKRGVKVGAIGGSDWHYTDLLDGHHRAPHLGACEDEIPTDGRLPLVPEMDKPVNLIHASEKSPAGIVDAMRKHHLIVLKGVKAARAFIGADVNRDGVFDDAREGDRVNAPAGTVIKFQARVIGGKGQKLHIIDRKGDTEVKVTSDDFVTAFERTASAGDGSFVRLELGSTGECVGNPIHY